MIVSNGSSPPLQHLNKLNLNLQRGFFITEGLKTPTAFLKFRLNFSLNHINGIYQYIRYNPSLKPHLSLLLSCLLCGYKTLMQMSFFKIYDSHSYLEKHSLLHVYAKSQRSFNRHPNTE